MRIIFKRIVCAALALAMLCPVAFAGGGEPPSRETDGELILSAAASCVLMDLSSRRILFESAADTPLPPASITKVMTMLLVIEAAERGDISYDELVTASEHACSMGGSQIYLKVGEQMTVEEMFKAVSIASANDAAVALAEHVGGSEELFVARMNERAKQLGMNNTTFKNACGLDEDGHVTTARDIAIMSAELCSHEKAFTYTTTWMDSVRNGAFGLVNTNKLIKTYNGITGLKTGSTGKAKYCMSATAERGGIRLCAVVMGCSTPALRFESAAQLLNYGFASYELIDITEDVELPLQAVRFGVSETVKLGFSGELKVLAKKGLKDGLTKSLEINEDCRAPIAAGDVLGTLTVTHGSDIVGKCDIIAVEDNERLTFGAAFGRLLKRMGF